MHNMKIYPRYLTPKSPLSERGLAIASLQVFYLITLFNIQKLIAIFGDMHNTSPLNLSKFKINMETIYQTNEFLPIILKGFL